MKVSKKTQRKGNKTVKKNMKGGFWPFTNKENKEQPVIDPNQPVAPKPTFWESIFGKKKPAVDVATNPVITTAPVPNKDVEIQSEQPVIPQAVEQPMYRGAGKRKTRKNKKTRKMARKSKAPQVQKQTPVVYISPYNYPMVHENPPQPYSGGYIVNVEEEKKEEKKEKPQTMKKPTWKKPTLKKIKIQNQ